MAKPATRPDGMADLVIEGLAIVSADGMIADRTGIQPATLKPEADQRFFHATLDAADVLVHGRNSGEGGPHAGRRRRIVLTRRGPGAARDPENANAVRWNPDGAPFAQAWQLLGRPGARVAVIGGTDVFGLFLDWGYDVFHLTRVAGICLPGGRPVFPGVPSTSPDNLLAAHGLKPDVTRVLDASGGVTLTTWQI